MIGPWKHRGKHPLIGLISEAGRDDGSSIFDEKNQREARGWLEDRSEAILIALRGTDLNAQQDCIKDILEHEARFFPVGGVDWLLSCGILPPIFELFNSPSRQSVVDILSEMVQSRAEDNFELAKAGCIDIALDLLWGCVHDSVVGAKILSIMCANHFFFAALVYSTGVIEQIHTVLTDPAHDPRIEYPLLMLVASLGYLYPLEAISLSDMESKWRCLLQECVHADLFNERLFFDYCGRNLQFELIIGCARAVLRTEHAGCIGCLMELAFAFMDMSPEKKRFFLERIPIANQFVNWITHCGKDTAGHVMGLICKIYEKNDCPYLEHTVHESMDAVVECLLVRKMRSDSVTLPAFDSLVNLTVHSPTVVGSVLADKKQEWDNLFQEIFETGSFKLKRNLVTFLVTAANCISPDFFLGEMLGSLNEVLLSDTNTELILVHLYELFRTEKEMNESSSVDLGLSKQFVNAGGLDTLGVLLDDESLDPRVQKCVEDLWDIITGDPLEDDSS